MCMQIHNLLLLVEWEFFFCRCSECVEKRMMCGWCVDDFFCARMDSSCGSGSSNRTTVSAILLAARTGKNCIYDSLLLPLAKHRAAL